jgi:hypothetical protein
MQVAHRQKGGSSVEEKDPTNPWPAPCHTGSRRPGRSPRPVAAQTRQGISKSKSLSPLPPREGLRGWVFLLGTNSTL